MSFVKNITTISTQNFSKIIKIRNLIVKNCGRVSCIEHRINSTLKPTRPRSVGKFAWQILQKKNENTKRQKQTQWRQSQPKTEPPLRTHMGCSQDLSFSWSKTLFRLADYRFHFHHLVILSHPHLLEVCFVYECHFTLHIFGHAKDLEAEAGANGG